MPPSTQTRGKTGTRVILFCLLQILATAEKERERITKESTEAVQQRLQQRARVLEQLPGFWGVALNQSVAADYITEDDAKLLEYLESVCILPIVTSLSKLRQQADLSSTRVLAGGCCRG